jgi:uncharacterized membrane protein
MAQIKKLSTELQPLDKLLDSSGDAGTSGQILSSTGSGTNWIAAGGSGTVTGSGTIGYIPKWTTTTALGNSVLQNDSSLPNDLIMPQYIRHSGDTNTYFGFYSNDTFIVATSNNEVMRVTSTGNVGIGTNSPSDKLTVNGNLSIFGNKIYNGSAANSAGVSFPSSTTRIDGYNGITFHSSTTTVGSQSERMRITNNGNVGIGTSSPSAILDITGIPWVNPADGTHSGWNFRQGGVFKGWVGYVDSNDVVNLSMDGSITQGINVNSSNNVGIGISSPAYKLDVAGTMRVKDGNSAVAINEYSNGATIWLDGSNGDFSGGDYFNISAYGTTDLAFGYGAGTKMTLKNTGLLGIGTTAPNEALEVAGNIRASGSYKVGATDVITSGRRFFAADGTGR